MKQQKKSKVLEQVKASRKKSREEEITAHGKAINYRKVMASKKQYNRKKNKADDEVLPYFFCRYIIFCNSSVEFLMHFFISYFMSVH